jgi:hypothetical protein
MTREQDLERRLADWLANGPVTAPTEVVDEAIGRTRGRRQRHPVWGWLQEPFARLNEVGLPRAIVLMAVLALTMLTALAIAVPLAGGPGPAPEMDPTAAHSVEGNATVVDESMTSGSVRRVLQLDVEDRRADGTATVSLLTEQAPAAGLQRSSGVMRLENAWGAWEGVVYAVRYPDGTELEYGWLTGRDAYEGFSYFHHIRGHSTEAERAVEGAIWPGEPPPMPDPSLLP